MYKGRKLVVALDVYYPLRNNKSPLSFMSCVGYPDGFVIWFLVNYHGSKKGPKSIGEALWLFQALCQIKEYGFDLEIITLDGGLADEFHTASGRKLNGDWNGKELEELQNSLMRKAPADEESSKKHLKLMGLSSRISRAALQKLIMCKVFLTFLDASDFIRPFRKWIGYLILLRVCLDLWHVLKAIKKKLRKFIKKYPDPAISGRTAVRFVSLDVERHFHLLSSLGRQYASSTIDFSPAGSFAHQTLRHRIAHEER